VHRFAIYAEGASQLPITDAYARRAVTLPMFAHMTEEQQDRVVDEVTAALDLVA
jgi:dTDP-4-amino-4,6-dideoxygalactose transaminase